MVEFLPPAIKVQIGFKENVNAFPIMERVISIKLTKKLPKVLTISNEYTWWLLNETLIT